MAPSFNEAPAERGGKLAGERHHVAFIGGASMRPPLNAGENRDAQIDGYRAAVASMRPPLNAGENLRPIFSLDATRGCFNEAPAERGGKQPVAQVDPRFVGGFNEAPAERGGKLERIARKRGGALDASMRPPLNAGENLLRDAAHDALRRASMRPPLNAGENMTDCQHGNALF